MSSLSLPAIGTLSSLNDRALTDVLDLLFEPSKHIHALLLPVAHGTVFPSYDALVDASLLRFLSLQQEAASDSEARRVLLSILGSHPRLGAKKVESAQSAAEQAQLNASIAPGEPMQLSVLNDEYEAKFPGLRYVVFVNGRSRDAIMLNMRERIARGDFAKEELEAIKAMCNIAKDRAGKLLSRKDKTQLACHGQGHLL